MEDEDFVADSDEDEQEMLEELAVAEERLARQRLEESSRQESTQQKEQGPTVEEHGQVENVAEKEDAVKEKVETQEEEGGEQEESEEDETDEEQEEEEEEQEHETDGVLDVGTTVEVDSRTWPGINKQGGAGRIVRVHREQAKDGEAEEIFYDVRYTVEGGVEKHIERKYVHSSKLLSKQSNRKKVGRDYYHDDFINEPHQRKLKEEAEKRERMMANAEQTEPPPRKRKRSQRSTRAERVSDNLEQNVPHSEVEAQQSHKRPKIDEKTFMLPKSNRSSLEVSSRPPSVNKIPARTSQAAQSPVIKQSTTRQRRRHHILDSSDDDSRDDGGGEAADQRNSRDRPEYGASANLPPNESPVSKDSMLASRDKPAYQQDERKKKKRKTSRRRYVGGYEHNGEDEFIQPEGDPAELPDDVIRETGLRLKNTRHGLMKQLQEIFFQKQQDIADFHEEQKLVDQKMMNLSGMPLNDLEELHHKVFNLDKVFLTKTLVNAGEDVMNKICSELERRGKLPTAFDLLDTAIGNWKDELKKCTRWVNDTTRAVKDAFTRREEQIPVLKVAQAEYSSDSSYSADDYEADDTPNQVLDADAASDDIDFSIDYEPENANARHQKRYFERDSKAETHHSKSVKQVRRKKTLTSTTMDDHFWRQGSNNVFRSNLRLIGRQKTVLPSDPRFNWAKLARRKQLRVRIDTSERTFGLPSTRISGGFVDAHGTQESIVSNHDDSGSVQAKRLNLRRKRFRTQQTQNRPREALSVRSGPQPVRNSRTIYPAGISFDDITAEKTQRTTKYINPTIHPSSIKQSINWEAVFEVVSDDSRSTTDEDSTTAISHHGQKALLAFGRPICDPLVRQHLIFDDEFNFEDCDSFRDVLTLRSARLCQLLNDLRLQEINFMDSLSRGGLGSVDEEGYANAPEWLLLVSLEEAYHSAITNLVVQLLETLEGISVSVLSSYIRIVLEEIAGVLRQLPDCDSLFSGCKAYFFFFEVAARDAATTPLLTAISRTYWYCLTLLGALRPMGARLLESQKLEVEDAFMRALPVNRVILGVVLFLFDLYIYLPSSHRLENKANESSSTIPPPALSLWMLVRVSCTNPNDMHQPDDEPLSTKESQFWTLLQTVYRQRYFDEITRCFIRGESCGGYLRDFSPKAVDEGSTKDNEENFESQLLASEATWDLVAVLTRIYGRCDENEHEKTVCDAKWAVVKDLLHPGKRYFLPFHLPSSQSSSLPLDYRQRANLYQQQVLKRVTTLSYLWRPCKEVIELIMHQMWDDNDELYHPDDIAELPQLLKQFSTRCKELGNSRLLLAAFAREGNDPDSITSLCRIIWIQLLKLDKRVHRSRFRSSILNAMPVTPDHQETALSESSSPHQAPPKPCGAIWIWGPQQNASAAIKPAKLSGTMSQRSPSTAGIGKERMRTTVLLTFAVVGVCLECGDEQQFPIERSDKEIKYMEREVDFYCKEILRWTSEKPKCEVLAAQALFVLGALLLDKNATEFPTIFSGLNDKLEASMKNLQLQPQQSQPKQSGSTNFKTSNMMENCQRLQRAAMSSLYLMRDLIRKMVTVPISSVRVGSAYGSAVDKSLEYVFGTGMEACLNGAIQKFVTAMDLKIAMEIFQLVLPRAPDVSQNCLAVSSAPSHNSDYMDDDAFFAAIDQDLLTGCCQSSTPIPAWTIKKCGPKAIQIITNKLRVVLQQLVLNYPPSDTPAFDELYAIDLLGMMLSTCEVQFFWSYLTSTNVKSRNLAPRVLSATLKYNSEKEWLKKIFLRDSGSDHELATTWLLATLDMAALNTDLVNFSLENVSFGVEKLAQDETTQNLNGIHDSDYWTMLTDGIIYHLTRGNSTGFVTMDPQLLQLLREVASTCKFPEAVRTNKDGLHDVATLYNLHLDVFQSFCKSVGTTWLKYTDDPTRYWHDMNQFRPKMMGIFVSFLEAYKINFRRACSEVDKMNHNWNSFAELFLRKVGIKPTDGRSYHEMDDTIIFDKRFTGLTTMFRFMYQCMDAFLFYCGEMAIGPTNLFFNMMELLFRQVNSAEYPQAIKRLEDQRGPTEDQQRLVQRGGVRNVNDELRKDFCLPAMRFVDGVQLFFARQKYPSLLHWFAQTSEIYQTFKKGWRLSPLRTLLVNILDPDGPLGIYSYYPDDDTTSNLEIDVRSVRREAFYLSCGFFNCRCTRSFEHSRAQLSLASCGRLKQLRTFVLNDFMRETFTFVLQEDAVSMLETMIPLCQFMRAVLNHANLNVNVRKTQADDAESNFPQDFQLNEIYPCLEWMTECLIRLVPASDVVNSTICCVLVTELCGIVCEAISFNEHNPMLELVDWVEIVLSYLQTIYVALSKRTTARIDPLFAVRIEIPPLVKLSTHQSSRSAFRDIVVEKRSSDRQMESYGISLARAATDLLAAIRRVAQQCNASSDEQLRDFTAVSP